MSAWLVATGSASVGILRFVGRPLLIGTGERSAIYSRGRLCVLGEGGVRKQKSNYCKSRNDQTVHPSSPGLPLFDKTRRDSKRSFRTVGAGEIVWINLWTMVCGRIADSTIVCSN
jgi:hypothetical protein